VLRPELLLEAGRLDLQANSGGREQAILIAPALRSPGNAHQPDGGRALGRAGGSEKQMPPLLPRPQPEGLPGPAQRSRPECPAAARRAPPYEPLDER
jgi:hypothetical protein